MFYKTKKRSLFVRIAFVLFAVALAFCSVSLALNDGKYKVSAYTETDFQFIGSHSIVPYFVSDFIPVNLGGVVYQVYFGLVYEESSNRTRYAYSSGLPSGSNVIFASSYGSPPTYSIQIGSVSFPGMSSSGGSYFYSGNLGSLVSRSISFTDSNSSYNPNNFVNFSNIITISYVFDTVTISMTVPNTCGITSLSDVDLIQVSFVTNESITESVTDVWTSIFTWLSTSVNSLLGILYINGELTILGVLVVMSLGISIFFLLLAVVSNFFHLRS